MLFSDVEEFSVEIWITQTMSQWGDLDETLMIPAAKCVIAAAEDKHRMQMWTENTDHIIPHRLEVAVQECIKGS